MEEADQIADLVISENDANVAEYIAELSGQLSSDWASAEMAVFRRLLSVSMLCKRYLFFMYFGVPEFCNVPLLCD